MLASQIAEEAVPPFLRRGLSELELRTCRVAKVTFRRLSSLESQNSTWQVR